VALAASLSVCALLFFVWSWHWPLVGDASLIHYIGWLIGRGWAPYREIGDMNMPGSYLIEMAAMHLFGMGAYAVLYGLVRATILFFAVAAFIGIHMPDANFGAALALLGIASISFIGIGMMTSVLPLISPEKGAQLGFIAQGLMLVVSGVYYPVSVMPHWMQWLAKISPATYALRGDRASIVNGAGVAWADVWPLLLIAAAAIPLGLAIFRRGERYAKKHGKLKRSG